MKKGNNNIVRKFESITELHNYTENGKVQPLFDQCQSSQRTDAKYWTGTENYEEADSLLLYGDKESANKVNTDGLNKLRNDIQKYITKRTFFTSVVGFAPHVPNYIVGVPNSMINQKVTRQRKKVATIVYSDTASANEDAEDISDTAAKVFAALMIIEAKGTQINMYTGVTATKAGQKIGFFVKVKRAGPHFDVLRMCYPCINPSFLRRHYFRFVEITEGVDKKFVNSYGCVCGQTDIEKLSKEAKIDADAVLSYETCKALSVDQIIKLITKQ